MAKALIGYLDSDLRTPGGELETLVPRLQEENDKLTVAHSAELIEFETRR